MRFTQAKVSIFFVFRPLILIFSVKGKVLSLENKKKSKLSFCISLTYSYLCSLKR